MASDPRAAQLHGKLAESPAQASRASEETDAVALHLPQLERSMKIVQRYAAVYSDVPFVSNVPLFGPLIVFARNLARRALRLTLSGAFGSQAEFNAAAAEILFEFTRRAAVSQDLPPEEKQLVRALDRVARSGQADYGAVLTALEGMVQELAVLRESTRAANLAAAGAEQQVMQLRQEVERLKHTDSK